MPSGEGETVKGADLGSIDHEAPGEPLGRGRALLFVSASGWLGGPGRSLLTLMANLPMNLEQILVSPTNGDLFSAVRDCSLV